jgi:serine/threonine protein kinase
MDETDRFEHFVILRRSDGSLWELGKGAMGVTYKAYDTNLHCDVALKVINSQNLNSETARQRFLREARAAASLRHPNVATVFHLGKCPDGYFYTMEYVEGETVERRLRREGPFPPELALRITRQVTRALIAADRQKLVHRDIKPSNIMLVTDEEEDQLLVKVIDFGLAKSLAAAADESVTRSMSGFVGTPQFASPEQLQEETIDIRSDIYSLGATLWFMLSGRPPFQGSMANVIYQHLTQPLPSAILMKFDVRVAALLEKMLAKRPEDRFQSPSELKRELDEVLIDMKGQFPTVVPANRTTDSPKSPSTSGFATGHLVRNRYEILGQSGFDKDLFKAKDIHSDRIVALRPLPLAARFDTEWLALFRREIEKLRTLHHPSLLEVLGFESYDRGLFVVSAWAKGFSLQELLRVRRELGWEEMLKIAEPVAEVLDFVADKQLLPGRLSLRNILISLPEAPDDPTEIQRNPISTWPPHVVQVDALHLGRAFPAHLVEQTQTVAIASRASDLPENRVQQLSLVIHELLGGVTTLSLAGALSPRFSPLPNLSEAGNSVLRTGALEPAQFASARDFLRELESAESKQESPGFSPAVATLAAFLESSTQEENQTTTKSPAVRRSVVGLAIAVLVCILAASFVAQSLLRKPQPSPHPAARTAVREMKRPDPVPTPAPPKIGDLVLMSDPPGLAVEIAGNGQAPQSGLTPMTLKRLPIGKYSIMMKRAGWPDHERTVDVQANATVTVKHAFQEVTVLLQSDPPGATVFKGDAELGKTPLTVSLPPSPIELVSRIGGLAPVSQQVVPDPATTTTVEFKHDYGVVAITSDQPDAAVIVGGVDAGKAPLEQPLPPGPQQIILRAPGMPDQVQTAEVQSGQRVAVQFTAADPGIAPSPPLPPEAQAAQDQNLPQPTLEQPNANQRRSSQAPVFRSRESYERARRESFRRFDAQTAANKEDFRRQRDRLSDRIKRASGSTQERLKRQMDQLKRREDQDERERRVFRDDLKQRWDEWRRNVP